MANQIRFILGSKAFIISKDEIKKIEGIQPEPIRKYYIEIEEEQYPIKQVFSIITGLPLAAFTSQDAFRILRKFGFEIKEI